MKNALLTLLFFVGLAATQLAAQSCCAPNPNCPPQCCIKGKSAATTDNAAKAETVATTTCTPEQMKQCTPEQLKQCAAAGQSKACCASKSAAVGGKPVNTTASTQTMEAKPVAAAVTPKG